MTENTSGALAVVICMGLSQALGYYNLALAGAGGLAVLLWARRAKETDAREIAPRPSVSSQRGERL